MWRKLLSQLSVVVLLGLSASIVFSLQASTPTDTRISALDSGGDSQVNVRNDAAGGCGLTVIFGAFCALWAQNTGRRPFLWFILGALFSVITVLVLLYKNSEDIEKRGTTQQGPKN